MKIAICVPHYGPLNARFVASLSELIAETAGATVSYNEIITRPEIKPIFEDYGTLELKRTRLARAALAWGADYVQWIDADHTFPGDAILRLARRDLPIVGCNYLGRSPTAGASALGVDGEQIMTTDAKVRADTVEIVGAVGLGFCLMKAPIFEVVPHPWFRSEISPEGDLLVGEDVHFANQARKAGLSVHLDHALSWHIGHVAEVVKHMSELGRSYAGSALPAAGP
jgi:hypothetical protein